MSVTIKDVMKHSRIVLVLSYMCIWRPSKRTNITMQDLLWSGFEGFIASIVL